jgi:hypothetical protein
MASGRQSKPLKRSLRPLYKSPDRKTAYHVVTVKQPAQPIQKVGFVIHC